MTERHNNKKMPYLSGIYETFRSSESGLKRYLRRFFYREEDIDDMAQETFLKAYKYTQGRKIDFPKAYLYQVAKSVALRELTKTSRQLTDYMEEACEDEPETQASLEEEVIAGQAVTAFCSAIAELPPQCRKVFLMRKYQAMSQRQIAEELNISISAVEQHITIGIKRCKASVEKRERMSTGFTSSASKGRRV